MDAVLEAEAQDRMADIARRVMKVGAGTTRDEIVVAASFRT